MRRGYEQAALRESDMLADPIAQFEAWFEQAVAANPTDWHEPNAMTLATATPDGGPSARVVLLKGVADGGFHFYTNYGSRKGREIAANPRVALTFFWPWIERQVRIEGEAAKVSREASEAYFHSRPRGSQLGAAASAQSSFVPDRDALEARLAELERLYGQAQVPLPDNWGGYAVTPTRIEFWQGRSNRLHDRLEYVKQEGGWAMRRLSP